MEEKFKQALKEQFKGAKGTKELTGLFQQMFKEAVEELLQGEMDEHLGYEKHAPEGVLFSNSRNGKSRKTVKTKLGQIPVEVPRDRDGSFEPQLIPKRKRILEEIEDHVLSLYSHGMSTRDIENHVREIYGVEMSEATISHITDRVLEHIRQWKSRTLEKVYFVVWMDAIVFKVRSEGKVIDKAVQLAIGLNNEGKKEVLGMWMCENESASFWMSVLTDLQIRGVKDILITSTDNLKGFTDAVKSIFDKTKTQICIVHQLRNSLKYVVWRERKLVAAALKKIYSSSTEKTAWAELEEFEKEWSKKYPYIAQSWKNNWPNLSTFFEFPLLIRKLIYTTNTIESVNRNIRKYTKAKALFPNDNAVEKAVYLALMKTQEKWTQAVWEWPMILLQFLNLFGHERCDIKL